MNYIFYQKYVFGSRLFFCYLVEKYYLVIWIMLRKSSYLYNKLGNKCLLNKIIRFVTYYTQDFFCFRFIIRKNKIVFHKYIFTLYKMLWNSNCLLAISRIFISIHARQNNLFRLWQCELIQTICQFQNIGLALAL